MVAIARYHLLSHTGGTEDIFVPLFDQNRFSLKTHSDYVRLFEDREATAPPRKHFPILELWFYFAWENNRNVSGQDYYEFLKENLFNKLGMKATGFEPEEQVSNNLTKGYMRAEDKWIDNNTLPWR